MGIKARSALIVTTSVAVTAFFSVYALIFALIGAGENSIHKIARIWARILLRIANIKVDVKGKENVIPDKPQIFMANHQSDLDVLITLAHVPGQFRWIAKKELFRIPVFGRAMKKAGYIPIDRENRQEALKSLNEAAMKIKEGKSVMSFPEGTRSADGTIKPFKQGMFYLAIQSGVPIVPITIIGAAELMKKRSLTVKPGTIKLIIDKPVDVSSYTLETRYELIEQVRNIIIQNFNTGYKNDSDG
ncbi:MAG: 1-acyl-sn-glycerol-3-phosphate acyltransferase [Syntrophales bacterium]|nr:1-acyl-sn-glycerol-3-phosphate acyltransferase [Syntrophales bacterium]